MDAISDVRITPCTESKYIKPLRLHYKQNDVEKIWDAMKEHDSVAILVFNTTRQVFVFVQQFRPAVYVNVAEITEKDGKAVIDTDKYPGQIGLTYELCAGIVDKDGSPQEIAQAELWEECGYKVPLENIKVISTYRSGIGTSGAKQTFLYAEVTDDMKVGIGGGIAQEGELIETIDIPISEVKQFSMDESKHRPVGVMFAVLWYFDQVVQKS